MSTIDSVTAGLATMQLAGPDNAVPCLHPEFSLLQAARELVIGLHPPYAKMHVRKLIRKALFIITRMTDMHLENCHVASTVRDDAELSLNELEASLADSRCPTK